MGKNAYKKKISVLKQKVGELEQQLVSLRQENQRLVTQLAEERLRADTHHQEFRDGLAAIRQERMEADRRSEEARARSDAIIMTLTQQLDRAHLQLEDSQSQRSVWRRLKGRFV